MSGVSSILPLEAREGSNKIFCLRLNLGHSVGFLRLSTASPGNHPKWLLGSGGINTRRSSLFYLKALWQKRQKVIFYKMTKRFKRCFPNPEGTAMLCQHWNNSWLVLPLIDLKQTKKKHLVFNQAPIL